MNKALATALVALIQEMNQKGWSAATGTNYSFRDEKNGYWVSASGIDKQTFAIDNFMQVDENGSPLAPYKHLKPSAENLIHAFIYKNTAANVILHTHSVYGTILSQHALNKGKKELIIQGYEVQKAITGITSHTTALCIPCFENNQDMEQFTTDLSTQWESAQVTSSFLIGNHGCYTWGKDLATAKRHIEALEFLFECVYKQQLLN